jgi:hypothetical protein
MKDKIIREFEGGKIWEHDIESANELVTEYIKSVGGDQLMAEDILDLIHNSAPHYTLNQFDGNMIIKCVEDYIDR